MGIELRYARLEPRGFPFATRRVLVRCHIHESIGILPQVENTRSGNAQYLWWLALAAAIGVLLYLLAPILSPFLFAAILAYIYFMRDWNRLTLRAAEMLPRRWYPQFVALFGEIDGVLGQFLRGQLLVMLLMGAFYTIALWLVGLDYALSVGMIAGLVTFVPYLGVITGVALATLTGILQFDSFADLVWVWGVFVLGNILEGYVLVPMLVGERIGLHPVAVLFALLAFGQLFGFFGVLLAVPVSASLLVWLRHMRGRYLGSGMYNA